MSGSSQDFVPVKIGMKPGYARDGSKFSNEFGMNGKWNRFYLKHPKKMGGFSRFNFDVAGTPREIWTDDKDSNTVIHIFHDNGVLSVNVDQNTGIIYPPNDRTPAAFVTDPNNSWQIDEIYDSAGSSSILLACKGLNIGSVDSSANGEVYYGDPHGISAFAPAVFSPGNPASLTGGLCVVHPYAFYYGDDGYITWGAPNMPFDLATGSGGGGVAGARIAESKIIKGNAFRGGTAGPTALFWSLNSIVRASYIGGAPVFSFSTLADYIAPLNSRCIVQYDSSFYWPDKGRFLTFNGSVSEIRNEFNLRWFYENLNWKYKSKCFGMSMADWGEIWWCFPYGDNTECSHAVILNIREQCFYDTALPSLNRTTGIESYGYRYPLMASNYERDGVSVIGAVWDHEKGTDEVVGSNVRAIGAYFETPFTSLPHSASGNYGVSITDYEPDILFTGTLVAQLVGRVTPNSNDIAGDKVEFGPIEAMVHFDEEFRMVRLVIESTGIGGSYTFGDNNLLYIQPAGQRNTV